MRPNSEALGKQILQQQCQRDLRGFVARAALPRQTTGRNGAEMSLGG